MSFDDISEGYLQTRQDAERQNSPLARLMRGEIGGEQTERQVTTPKPENQTEPNLEEIDPVASKLGSAVDFGVRMLRPLGAAQAFAAAPIAHNYESETFGGKLFESFAVAGKAALNELLPDSGFFGGDGKRPPMEAEILEKFAPGIPEPLKPAAEIAVGLVTDPAFSGLFFTKSIKKGLELSAREMSTQGPFRRALEEAVSFVPMKDEEFARLSQIAKKADTGNTKAAKELFEDVSIKAEKNIDERLQKDALDIKAAVGDETKPVFSVVSKSEAKALLAMEDTDLPKHSINLNLSRINSEDDVKQIINKLSKQTSSRLKNKQGSATFKEIESLAKNLDLSVEDLLSRRTSDFTTSEVLAARQIMVSSAETLSSLAKRAGAENAGKVDLIAFRKALAVHQAIREQVTGITADVGRTLSQFNISAGSTKARLQQIDDLIEGSGFSPEQLRITANAMADMETVEQVNAFAKKALHARTSDVVMEVWINGLLSGPTTHAVNVLSNSVVAAIQVPERLVASGFSKLLNTGENGIRSQEAVAQAYGLFEGVKDSFSLAGRTITGKAPVDLVGKIELSHPKAISAEALELSGAAGRFADFVGKIVRVPGGALQVEDAVFKGIGYRMELNARAMRAGLSEGLQGEALAKRVNEIKRNPPEDIHLVAIDAARYQTYTSELSGLFKDYQSAVARTPALRVITPFIRTPVNIMKFAFERTPFAPIAKTFREDIKAGGARRDLALARVSTGSLTMGMVAQLTQNQQITGGGPVDTKLRAANYLSGWQPYSILIGDTYHSYSRLEPVGTLIGIAADYAEISGQLDKVEAGELASMITMAAAKNITSKTFLSGISEAINVLSDPERYGDRYLQRFAGSVVPFSSLGRTVSRELDPTMREMRTVMDAVLATIPGYSKNLPPRRNIFAEPIVLSGGLGPDIMSPIYTSEVDQDNAVKEITRLNIPLGMPAKQMSGVELTPEQYDKLVTLTAGPITKGGDNLRQALNTLVDAEEYKRQSEGEDGGKALMLRQIFLIYKNAGRAKMIEQDHELQINIQQALNEKGEALRPSR